ncbi:CDF family Co(II)/Ni(II) efflux transporter DmeF [Sphingobium boeckii]|uniref:Cation diffusion facilitator family transporter n=1 Tax=Sphingobium boeckii TaxID=1082345 RepID=A0A7W9EFZ7_9SPHN|nr:CDF family Co(II)/Ni(II) efflux transporter DmeF [Sphingobium boeckii]MBB5687649.1 cation diffusion facilitator family transporter [Sphingobium boeckii]
MTPDRAPLPHDHVFLGHAHDENARRTRWVVILTAVMMVAEITAGMVYGSMALLADGFHMATHAGALALAAAAYHFARKHARDPRFSFGTGKVGDLAGFASALVLATVALGIAWESVVRIVNPLNVAFEEALIVAVIGLIVNIISAMLLTHGHDHDHEHGHAHHHDNNMRSAYVHVLADALTSVFAIAALIAGWWLGWVWLDPVVGLMGAAVIARWAWTLMKDTGAVLLDADVPELSAQVRHRVEAPGDARINDLHVWRVGPTAYAAIVCVDSDGPVSNGVIRERLAGIKGLRHVTVECGVPHA